LGAIVPGGFLAGALAIRLFRPKSFTAMTVMALGLAASAFCLAPAVGGIAWQVRANQRGSGRRSGPKFLLKISRPSRFSIRVHSRLIFLVRKSKSPDSRRGFLV
jgi:hypothetical protein